MTARDEAVEAQFLGGAGGFEDVVELGLVSGPQAVRCDSRTHVRESHFINRITSLHVRLT
ncbi:hypothetical protein [Streptomyces sp. NPDC005760]|uniref:hypothetical protein n=1 Tax=Streptomyces sp. NPDC005760 TaxID=3156718 RepID=UPI0033DAEFE4